MGSMNGAERSILVAGLVLLVLSCLYLPVLEYGIGEWSFGGWHWITAEGRRVDLARLVAEWVCIGALVGIARLLLLGRRLRE